MISVDAPYNLRMQYNHKATSWTTGIYFRKGILMEFFSLPRRPDQLWGPYISLSSKHRGILSPDVMWSKYHDNLVVSFKEYVNYIL